jgi:hypothetical protein
VEVSILYTGEPKLCIYTLNPVEVSNPGLKFQEAFVSVDRFSINDKTFEMAGVQ